MPIRVTVWNEFRHEKKNPKVKEIYPEGMHATIAAALKKSPDLQVRTATLDEPQNGLGSDVVNSTDVMVWWGHMHHDEVNEEAIGRLHERIVVGGIGLVVLHSGHFSRIFKRLMGTTCNLKWREADEREVLWVTRRGIRSCETSTTTSSSRLKRPTVNSSTFPNRSAHF